MPIVETVIVEAMCDRCDMRETISTGHKGVAPRGWRRVDVTVGGATFKNEVLLCDGCTKALSEFFRPAVGQ